MVLKRTQEGSQFICFDLSSILEDSIFTHDTPRIKDKKIEVLQVAYINSSKYDVIVEFKYIEDNK